MRAAERNIFELVPIHVDATDASTITVTAWRATTTLCPPSARRGYFPPTVYLSAINRKDGRDRRANTEKCTPASN